MAVDSRVGVATSAGIRLSIVGPVQVSTPKLETKIARMEAALSGLTQHRGLYYGSKLLFKVDCEEQERLTQRGTSAPQRLLEHGTKTIWWFRNAAIESDGDLSADDVRVLAMEAENKRRLRLEKAYALAAMRNAVDHRATRQPIPQEVKLLVWQRDRGRCVECGVQSELEFDHIIPLAMGGSNTDRNSNSSARPAIGARAQRSDSRGTNPLAQLVSDAQDPRPCRPGSLLLAHTSALAGAARTAAGRPKQKRRALLPLPHSARPCRLTGGRCEP